MTGTSINIYGKYNPQDVPAYNLAEAARYLHIATATLRSWVIGRSYPRGTGTGFFEPLIRLPDSTDRSLSFANLVEAHVLRALRTKHRVSIRAVRTALEFAQKAYGVKRLLLSPELRAGAGDLSLDKYVELVNLSRSGQMVLREVFKTYLMRVKWEQDLPTRLYPFLDDNERIIAIDPFIAFGRPVIISKGISTAVITDRIDAGESIEDIAKDYGLTEIDVKIAMRYEKAA